MPSRTRRVSAAAALALALLSGCSDDDDSPTVTPDTTPGTTAPQGPPGSTPATGNVVSVTVRGGNVEGASRQRAPLNQPVIVRVTSDVADEIHVHGYDKRAPVAAGSTTDLRFDATIPGVFEVELERAGKTLFTLEVR